MTRTVAQRDLSESLLVSFNEGVFIHRPLSALSLKTMVEGLCIQCEPLHTRPKQRPDCFRPPPTAVSLETVEELLDPMQPSLP
jgi:hypothetical protein